MHIRQLYRLSHPCIYAYTDSPPSIQVINAVAIDPAESLHGYLTRMRIRALACNSMIDQFGQL